MPPRQIEFAKMYLTNVVTGKRYIKKLVEDGIVDGWDDPRLVTITALRRRGYTASSIRKFMELCGVSKSNSSVDSAMLEYCIREDLKMSQPRMMAVLDPVKLVIDNYEEGKIEYLDVPNLVHVRCHLEESCILRERISRLILHASISVCSRAMKYV